MYFTYLGRPGGHVAAGQTTLAKDLDLAEGFVSSSFDEFITLFNPNGSAASVQLSYLLTGGGSASQSVTVPADSRSTIYVNSATGNPHRAARSTLP